ncbi:hypothetical protein R84981_002512 [Carnimonas sp. R-84981]|uniref:hypothetical protein n=1 Tax=Carnimonas bestiolae TaxID=3402172 RepID=UPI003EDB9564
MQSPKWLMVALVAGVACLSVGCASLDQSNGKFAAHSGVHAVRATNQGELERRSRALCPHGYQVMWLDRDFLDWQSSIQCKPAQ